MLRVITLGVIVTLVVSTVAGVAGAQPGKGKALGHKTAANTDGATPQEEVEDSKKVEVCHVPPGNPENAHVISISRNALKAHEAHGDTQGPCEGAPPPGGPGDICDLEGKDVEVETDAGITGEVDEGDVLLIPGDFDEPAPDASITIKDPATGKTFTFVNGTNADIAVDPTTGDLSIVVGTTDGPTELTTPGLVVESSQGITCTDPESGTVTGEVAETEDGTPILKTASGDVLKLELAKKDSKQGKQRLKSLKGHQIQAEGELEIDEADRGKNKTFKAAAIKKVKASGKKAKAKGKKK